MPEKTIDLSQTSEEELLKVSLSDLPVRIEGAWLEDCIKRLYKELAAKGIRFKPACYLTDEWLTPDGEPVVGIPFFLAHPALRKLEKKMMREVEGGTRDWCLKLLRHEAGHGLNYAYKLYRRQKWKKVFGKFSSDYPETYRFRPYSKSFVKHLENYYAQYHPDEDFAETFAVWLTPKSDWQARYKGWKALDKLQYVDELMEDIRDREPLVRKGKKYWQVSSLRTTLKNYYKKKRHFYAEEFLDFHDRNLQRIFSRKESKRSNVSAAAALIGKYRKDLLNNVSAWTGEKKYIIDALLETIMDRCRERKLAVAEPEEVAVLKIATYVTTLIMNYIHTGRFAKEK